MPEEITPRRRRARQVIPQELLEDEAVLTPPAPKQEAVQREMQPAPVRIVIDDDGSQPDWMVSAGQVSGAASRRSKHAVIEERPAQPQAAAADRAASQVQQINRLKKGEAKPDAAAGAAAAPKPRAEQVKREPREQAQPAPKPAPRKKLSKKARARRARQIRSAAALILTLAVIAVLAVTGVVGVGRLMTIKTALDQGDGVFYPNISVNGIPLGGMTLDQAASVVTQHVTALVDSFRITLMTDDGRTWDITGQDLKMEFNVADQLDQLWAIGHTGPSSQRYEQVKALEENPITRYTTLTYDMSAINQILTQIKSEVDREPVSAMKVYDETRWPPYAYTDDVPGQELDITGLNEQIMGMVNELRSGEVVRLTPTPVQAPITRAYLEGQIVQLASYETSISKAGDYAEARHENIRVGTEKFRRLVIKSGEQVSFNKVTGLRSERNGFVVALELAYGKYVEGVGGGICQVSSTLYNAVVNAGLEVKSRTQHSLPSSYVEKGLDATVQDNRIDFVFKNSTSADIFIDAEYYKGKNGYYRCKFTIWGRPDPHGYSYKLVPEVVEPIAVPDMVYQKDKDAQYVVYDDEQYLASEGQEGYIVDVYRVTLDSKGLEVRREKMYTDTYKAVAPLTYVGVTPRETPVPEMTPGSVD